MQSNADTNAALLTVAGSRWRERHGHRQGRLEVMSDGMRWGVVGCGVVGMVWRGNILRNSENEQGNEVPITDGCTQ